MQPFSFPLTWPQIRPFRGRLRRTRASLALALGLGLGGPTLQMPEAQAQLGLSCGRSPEEVQEKSDLLRASIGGDRPSQRRYEEQVQAHQALLQECRRKNWPQKQALWLRLYPCDVSPGVLDQVLDQAVNMGYNQVYVEVFYDGRVLLPQASNPTVWPSVMNQPGQEKTDLFQIALEKGRARGLEMYAWMYTINFGYSYGQRGDRRSVIARNGRGQTSLDLVPGSSQTFVDPYNRQAMLDYYRLVEEVIKRRPDGVLFDYVRYPRGSGPASVAGGVKDLLVYGDASKAALLSRATNRKGRELIARFLRKGYVGVGDLKDLNKKFPQEGEPLWQGRIPGTLTGTRGKSMSLNQQQKVLQQELWLLGVAHAYQGVIDFLDMASRPVQQAGLPSGAVFFPGGNKTVGQTGFDSRLQPWDRFSPSLQWHPMAYSTCGTANCIVDEVKDVLNSAPPGVKIQPALAGAWGRSAYGNRPSLEQQMASLRSLAGSIQTVSHFAYSWQQPTNDTNRKFCQI